MVFLRSVGSADFGPVIHGRGIRLRVPQLGDYAAWAELRTNSRNFLTPWEPTWPSDDLSRASFRRRIRRYCQDVRDDSGYPFFVFDADDETLIGGLTLGNVRRGVTQSCGLGYWVGEQYARKGYMSRAVTAALGYVFSQLGLHRVEAACLPQNRASIRLLEKTGFSREGYARRYLCINGKWQDHLLYAMLHDDPRPTAR